MKRVALSAFVPELPAGHAWQESRGEGSNLTVAIKRAVEALMSQPKVKGRRLHSLKLTIVVEEKS